MDSEAEQCWEEEAENEGGNDGALAEEKHFEEWVGGKIGSWWKETKGVLLLLGARRKKMAFSLEPGWRRGKFQSEKERESWSSESKKKITTEVKNRKLFHVLIRR